MLTTVRFHAHNFADPLASAVLDYLIGETANEGEALELLVAAQRDA